MTRHHVPLRHHADVLPSDVERLAEIVWEDEDDADLYQAMVADATVYLEQFSWCSSVRALYGGKAVPGVVAVFLAAITPSRDGIDERLWVIVGDLPPAYLVLDDAPTSDAALGRYVDEMEAWVSAVRGGRAVDDLIPVDVEPSPEHADMLATRLDFLRSRVLGS